MTYKEFKSLNDTIKKRNKYMPMTIKDVQINPNGIQLDEVLLSTGQYLKIVGLINGMKYGIQAVTNPSKLSNWRGFKD